MRLATALFACGFLCQGQTPKEVRAAAKQGPGALPLMQQYLTNPDVYVRLEAVKGIVEIGSAHSLNLLIQAAGDNDPDVQIRAADGLVNFYLPGYVRTGMSAPLRRLGTSVKSRFTDTNDEVIDPYIKVRADVARAVSKMVATGASMESRAHAARAAGILRLRVALPDLEAALHSKDTNLIYESLVALQKIGDKSAGASVRFLLRDMNERVQVEAIALTGLLDHKSALPDLVRVLGSSRKEKVRRATLTAIAMLPDAGSRQLYGQYLVDKDEHLRGAAAEGFARLRNSADVPALQKALDQEGKLTARLSLAFALVMDGQIRLGEASPLRYLVNSLNSVSYRGEAAAFLVEAAHSAAVRDVLYGPLQEGTKDERIQLTRILALTGDKDSAARLEQVSRDSDAQVATEGLRALRNLKARL